jgi:hypothetical protein
MHEPLFAQAALPAETTICGVPLRPYSLGHELYLIREKSPLLFGGEALPPDLFQAIWICGSTWNEMQRPGYLDWLKLWIIDRRVRKCGDCAEEIEAFLQYRANGCLEFPLSEIAKPSSGPSPRQAGAPFIGRLHHFLVTQYRLSIAEAWDFRCGEAKMRWMTHWEQEGGLDIYNDHDASFDRYIQEQEARGKELNGRT